MGKGNEEAKQERRSACGALVLLTQAVHALSLHSEPLLPGYSGYSLLGWAPAAGAQCSLPAAFLDVPPQRGYTGREDFAGQEWWQNAEPSFPPPGWEDRVLGVHPGTVGHLPGNAGREAEV